jgi:very-short-patch-repair endonuclease
VIAALGEVQHDLVARWQLIDRGVSPKAIEHRLLNDKLRRVRPGVYEIGRARLTRRGRWMADVLACGPDSGLTGISTLQLMDVMRLNDRRTVVVSAKQGRRKPKGIDFSTTRDVTFITWDGIPTTPLHRALADAAPFLDDEQLEAAYERAITDRQLDPSRIPQQNKRLNQLIKDHRTGTALTDSELENLFRRILKSAALPQPLSNKEVWTPHGWYRPDFVWLDQKLIAEVDGFGVHKGQAEADARRGSHLSSMGFVLQRFRKLQMIRHAEEICAGLRPFL